MKRFAISLLALAFTASAAIAQDDMKKDNAKEKIKSKDSQEITIVRKGDKDVNVTVEIKGDKILVNGKPLAEFKDDNVIVNNRKVTVWDGDHSYSFSAPRMAFGKDGWGDSSWKRFAKGEKRALLGVTSEKADGGGVEITKVTDESGADKAGLKAGDIITKVDDRKIENENDLSAYITSKKPKDEVTIHYKRDGKSLSSKATLGETDMVRSYSFSMPQGLDKFDMNMEDFNIDALPAMPRAGTWNNDAFGEAFGNGGGNGMMFNRRPKIGLKIQDVDEGTGVKVLDSDEDSPAAKAGLKKGDIITEINGKKVANTDEAREQLKPEEGKGYSIKAKRDGKEMTFDVKIPKKLKTANL